MCGAARGPDQHQDAVVPCLVKIDSDSLYNPFYHSNITGYHTGAVPVLQSSQCTCNNASTPPPSHLSKIAPKHSKNGCLSIMPMLCQTRPLATLSAQTEPSRYRSDQARPRPRQDPPLDLLPCPTTAVILASVVKIDDCMAVCQLLAGILGLIGHLRTAASTLLDEATERRAATSTVTSVMMPCRPAPPRCSAQQAAPALGVRR